ncbi:MAG: TIGR02996 domain-containing protein [Gemmataceae bacterium]
MNFEQAIVDNPTDIALRLVYADWLEEQGDDRAEFVRLDCELREPTGPLVEQQAKEERWLEMWQDLDEEWLERLFTIGIPTDEAKCLLAHSGYSGTEQVIAETTRTGTIRPENRLSTENFEIMFRKRGTRPSYTTIADFRVKNRRTHAIKELFHPENYGFVIVSAHEMNTIFQNLEQGWDTFRDRFPESAGTVQFSRVGFNHTRTEAVFYWGQQVAPLMGFGNYFFYKKMGGQWVRAGVQTLWIS